jgi:hypothetical protein
MVRSTGKTCYDPQSLVKPTHGCQPSTSLEFAVFCVRLRDSTSPLAIVGTMAIHEQPQGLTLDLTGQKLILPEKIKFWPPIRMILCNKLVTSTRFLRNP